jgi:hypothetical protein
MFREKHLYKMQFRWVIEKASVDSQKGFSLYKVQVKIPILETTFLPSDPTPKHINILKLSKSKERKRIFSLERR